MTLLEATMPDDPFTIFGYSVKSRSSFERRFWNKVAKTTEKDDLCWLWTGKGRIGFGYGKMSIVRSVPKLAHRISWVLANGPIESDLLVLHRCDTVLCVRPSHLFLGTHRDNHADMVAKGRNKRGENDANAVLTPEIVRRIRQRREESGLSYVKLGKEFGICGQQVWAVVTRKIWRHV
jgi:hypothetical protein